MKEESYIEIVLFHVLYLLHVAVNTPTANCLTCRCLLPLHLPQSGYIGYQCKLSFMHEIAVVIALLNGMTVLLTTCPINSLFQWVIDVYSDLLIQPDTKRVTSSNSNNRTLIQL